MDSKELKIDPRFELMRVVQSGKLVGYLNSSNLYDITVVRIEKVH